MVTSLGGQDRYLQGDPSMRVVNSLCHAHMQAEVVILGDTMVM